MQCFGENAQYSGPKTSQVLFHIFYNFITTKQNAVEANGKKVAQFDLQDNFIADFETCVEAALALGKPYTAKANIASCCRGINHTAFGFKWKFI